MTRIVLVLLAVTAVQAQPSRTLDQDPWCASQRSAEPTHSCQVREFVIQQDDLDLDASPNGSVSVKRWERDDVLVRARVESQARTRRRAQEMQDEIRVEVDGGDIRATRDGSDWGHDGEWSSVSYEVFAPRRTDLQIRTLNGAALVHGIEGDVDVQSLNGAIALSQMAGDVRARSVNGSVSVDLSGRAWAGRGVEATTTNGSVSLKVPRDFSARLRARTQVGRIALSGLDVVQHDRRRGQWMGDQIETQIGRGGASVELTTVNGSVRIEQER